MYQRKVDVDMLNAVKSMLADISSISPSSEQKGNTSLLTIHTEFVSVQDKFLLYWISSIKHYDNEPFFQSV